MSQNVICVMLLVVRCGFHPCIYLNIELVYVLFFKVCSYSKG